MNRPTQAKSVLLLSLLAALLWGSATAQDPLLAHCQSIRMIVPYTAGGGGDVGARLLAPEMAADLGVPIQVENLPGAGSQIGVTELTQAKPDGCTIGWTHLPAVINIYLDPSRQAAFDRSSLEPIAMYVIDPGGIAVKGDSPYSNLSEFIEAARQQPGKISISDSGVLSDGHLLVLELQRLAGVEFAIVHSAGGAEGTADLLGGHVTAQAINLGGSNAQMAEAGQIKVLATFTTEQVASYPGVQTATEQGFPILSSTSRALSAPAGTPAEVIQRLSESVGKVMASPDFQARAADLGLSLAYMDAATLGEYWDKMETTFGPLIADYLANQ